jgi:hypothetical protein
MKFYKTVNTILEEVRPKQKYQLLSPDNYTDLLILQTKNGIFWGKQYIGMLHKVIKATQNTSVDRPLMRSDKAIFDMIKKTWRNLNLVSGWEIRMYGNKEDIVNVKDRAETLYIVNDDSDLPDWDLLDSYYHAYGKPSAFEETDDEVKDVFGDVYGEL